MSDYRIQFLIDAPDLKNIKAAQQRITLAKQVFGVSGDRPSVVWLSIDPFPSTDVEWSEEYGLYASATAFKSGSRITKLSETALGAVDRAYYTLTPAAVFNGPFTRSDIDRGTYAAENDVPHSEYDMLTFGLTQTALVNQAPSLRKPISAEGVLPTQFIYMTPATVVYAWLQSEFVSETMITKIVGKNARITLGGKIHEIIVTYNPAYGMFVPLTSSGEVDTENSAVELSGLSVD